MQLCKNGYEVKMNIFGEYANNQNVNVVSEWLAPVGTMYMTKWRQDDLTFYRMESHLGLDGLWSVIRHHMHDQVLCQRDRDIGILSDIWPDWNISTSQI